MLSPEDVEDWIDSCLSKESDTSDSGWDLNSVKGALLETQATPENNSFPYESDDSTEQRQMRNFSKADTVDGRNLVETAINNTTATSIEAEQTKSDHGSDHDNIDDFWSSHKLEDVFLPTYNESLRDIGVSDPEVDFVLQEFKLEQSTEDIFKTWDLNIPNEEDDGLVKQLNNALEEKSLDPISPVSGDDSEVWKSLQEDEELDDLISGIADLGLSSNSDLTPSERK